MHLEPTPPAAPAGRPQTAGLAGLALIAGVIAVALALPVLWWRIVVQPEAATWVGEVVQAAQADATSHSLYPGWYAGVRASAMMAAFVALLLAVIALILRHSGRLAGIAMVLACAAFAACSTGWTLVALGGLLLLVIGMLSLGLG